MHYLIAGLAKSGTTRLFSQLKGALDQSPETLQTFFEPDTDEALKDVLSQDGSTLTKVLIGRVSKENAVLEQFDSHVLIYRDPRDQFISMLLYLFYDFQVSGDAEAYAKARQALKAKVESPSTVSTIELYNTLATLVGRGPIGVFKRLHAIQREYEDAFSPFMLCYEDLLQGKNLSELSTYTGLALEGDAEVPAEYTRVARSRGFGEWRSWLNAEDLEFIDREWGENISYLGYALEPEAKVLEINPQTSLDYVAQFDPTGGS
ncbi:hypothetical protein R0137_14885 [Congregibacter brevis]|uniref:Sulfotransferase domain-containing protein n=1 Tax=Congregibacter brevis TaxID=3081201 RepID=A0ABZ0IAJ8_9GAMM|nr:hypothetical protein R0137_14885 [Congregibacter sp. IMCC45268]